MNNITKKAADPRPPSPDFRMNCPECGRRSSWNSLGGGVGSTLLGKKIKTDLIITFWCRPCDHRWERVARAAEKKKYESYSLWNYEHTNRIHRLWWKFRKKFCDPDGKLLDGYDLMKKIRKFSEKEREILIFRCDDSCHTSSSIVMIPHQADGEYWGTTVFVITQCDGQPPVQFFLYPSHVRELVAGLNVLDKKARTGWSRF